MRTSNPNFYGNNVYSARKFSNSPYKVLDFLINLG